MVSCDFRNANFYICTKLLENTLFRAISKIDVYRFGSLLFPGLRSVAVRSTFCFKLSRTEGFFPVPLRTHDAPVSERDRHALGEICLSDNGKYHRSYRPSQRRNPYVYRETFVFPEGKFAVLFFTEEALLARACVQCGCVRRGVVSGSAAEIVPGSAAGIVQGSAVEIVRKTSF